MFLLSVDIDVIIFDFFLLSSHQILMKQCTTLYKIVTVVYKGCTQQQN